MAAIADEIQNALNEGRILILGAQILVGLHYRAAFEPGFDRLPGVSRYASLLGLALILISFGLLMAPAAYHRIVDRGTDHHDLESFVFVIMKLALFPFAISLGLTTYVAAEKVLGIRAGVAVGGSICVAATLSWYGLGHIRGGRQRTRRTGRQRATNDPRLSNRCRQEERKMESREKSQEELKDKINHILTEARMVLPGAQALLGFQFVIMLMDDFDKLSRGLQEIHLLGLVLIAITTILLMTPAAYHRLVEKGKNSEEFHRFASALVLASMIPLAAGISADYYVVARKVTGSPVFAAASAMLLMILFYGLWFGFCFYRRRRLSRTA